MFVIFSIFFTITG